MSQDLVNVGIGDIAASSNTVILRTILGSCVGICIYDEEKKIGGLAHIMLPVMPDGGKIPNKYADTAIPNLIEEMENLGADLKKMTAKIVGGATMFKLSEDSFMGEIGKNNTKKVKEILEQFNIPIIAEKVGGDKGRSIDFFLENGQVRVKSVGSEDLIL